MLKGLSTIFVLLAMKEDLDEFEAYLCGIEQGIIDDPILEVRRRSYAASEVSAYDDQRQTVPYHALPQRESTIRTSRIAGGY